MKSTRTSDRGGAANRTGLQTSPLADEMLELDELAGPSDLVDDDLDSLRAEAMAERIPVGSKPDAPDARRALLLDKLGARLAFERTGTRLYEGIIAKAEAGLGFAGGPGVADLQRIRDEEAEHAALLLESIAEAGGDPTVVTPCANLQATASTGVAQVITDPRTDVAECLEAIMIAELADRESWTTLIALARELGQEDLVSSFEEAGQREEEHVVRVRGWLEAYRRAEIGGGAGKAKSKPAAKTGSRGRSPGAASRPSEGHPVKRTRKR